MCEQLFAKTMSNPVNSRVRKLKMSSNPSANRSMIMSRPSFDVICCRYNNDVTWNLIREIRIDVGNYLDGICDLLSV